MSTISTQAPASDGISQGYTPAPDPNSLAAAQNRAGVGTGGGNERPSWLPDNFKTPEDFRKSFDDLRADHTKKSQALAELQKGQKPAEGEGDDDATQKALSEAGIPAEDMQQWSEKFWETGEVPADAYEKLAKVGITKDIIDDYAKSKQALVEGQRNALLNAGGGEENVKKMFDWAVGNLSKEQIAVYNNAFDSGDLNASMIAMEGLKAKYAAVEGSKPELVGGGNLPTANSGSVYTSVQQVQQDMSDPRYKMDPAFRRSVEQKLGRSKVF